MPKILRPTRVTAHINRKPAQSIFRAFDYAKAHGTPLNLYVVINLHETDEATATTLFSAIRHKFRDWLNYRTNKDLGRPLVPRYVYAFENPNGQHPHVNWVLHLPSDLIAEFEAKLLKWVAKVQGPVGTTDIDVQRVRQSHDKRLAKYILKGIDPEFVGHFYLDDLHSPQGPIWGRRASTSPSLGPTARRNAGYVPRRRRMTWQGAEQ